MSYVIEKQFEAHVAHRVHNQCLYDCLRGGEKRPEPCKSWHGHTANFIVRLESNRLVNEMVLDFNLLNFFKAALNEHYDHRWTICRDDPLFDFLVDHAYQCLDGCEDVECAPVKIIDDLDGGEGYRAYTVDISDEIRNHHGNVGEPLIELLDSFTIVDFTTTSENLAHWAYNVIDRYLARVCETTKDEGLREILKNVKVHSVSYKESPKSMATYQPA